MLIESLSGVRGYEQDLTATLVTNYAYALRLLTGCQKVVIGRDSRASGTQIQAHLLTALQSAGVDVLDLGICPTPTVQYAVLHLEADNGIVITASHNPLPWNGLKFIGKDGMFLSAAEMEQLRTLRLRLADWRPSGVILGSVQTYPYANADHVDSVLQLPYIEPARIRARRFKVVVDAVNGAASLIIPDLLEQLGCEVVRLYCNPNNPFPHTPEPLPENLTDLQTKVKEVGADLGLAIDPDGDRLAVISDRGEPISEEYTLVLAAKLVLAHTTRQPKIVVANLSTTMAVDDIARQYGAQVVRTPIGEINVARKMAEVGATVGGEGNGGVILPETHLGRDSLVGAALILQLLAEEHKSISQLTNELPRYYMIKQKVPRGELAFEEIVQIIETQTAGATINREDGIKLSWPDRWIHLRSSNTEPILRLYTEASSPAIATELAQKYSAIINQKLANR